MFIAFKKYLKCVIFPFEMLYFGPDILFIPAGLFSCSQISLYLLDWKLLGDKFPPSQPSRRFAFSFPCKSTMDMDIVGQCLMLPVLETLVLEIAGR